MLNRSVDLIDEYLRRHPDMSERQLSMRLGYSDMALQMARRRERLSPVVAGQLADALGLDVKDWMVTAAFESEAKSDAAQQLRERMMIHRRKRSLPNLHRTLRRAIIVGGATPIAQYRTLH